MNWIIKCSKELNKLKKKKFTKPMIKVSHR